MSFPDIYLENVSYMFERVTLDVINGFGKNRSMFHTVVFLIQKNVYGLLPVFSIRNSTIRNKGPKFPPLRYKKFRR